VADVKEVILKMEEDFDLMPDAGMAKLAVFGNEQRPVTLVAGSDGTTITVKIPDGIPVRRITEG
jgi:hypothetical protein